jgi:SAM-dependent methyltransferase
MIRQAKRKAKKAESEVEFQTLDFLDISLEKKFDVVFMVFDSLNYLHSKKDIAELHDQVHKILKPNGIFVYDFTTPRNSRKAIRYLDDEQDTVNNRYTYHRSSRYDEKSRVHTNTFEIEQLSKSATEEPVHYLEEHHQKIYTMNDILPIVKDSPFRLVQAYDGFELKPAHKRSLRITMVLR